MARPRKLQEGEMETMSESLVRNAIFSVKTTPASVNGDITIQEMNAIMDEFVSKGYKVISAYPIAGASDSVQIYVCMVKQ